jgi:Ice-binding-like/Putative metal-binding motif
MKKVISKKLDWIVIVTFLIPLISLHSQCLPSLGSASDFTIFTAVGALSNTSSSTIEGNIGTNAGTITGFEAATISGNTLNATAATQIAATELISAYAGFQSLPATSTNHSPTFGSEETLLPGVYAITTAGSISGILNFDAQFNSNAKFIIKFGGAFTSQTYSTVVLKNGAQANNIYWIVEGAFSLAANCIFKGTIISNGAIDVSVGNQLNCKLLSISGAISTYGTQLSISGITNTHPIFYADNDLDGYGNILVNSCDYISGYILNSTDCDDTDGGTHPNAIEIYGNNIDDNCNGITDSDTFICGTTTTWNGTMWSNGIPTYEKTALFSASYTTSFDLYTCSVLVTNNASVVLDHNLFVFGSITVEPNSSLTQHNNVNIIQVDPTAINSGNIQVNRNTATIVRLDHTLWSSPVTGQNIYNFSPETLPYRIYTYDTLTDTYLSSTLSNSSIFAASKGYAIRAPNNFSATIFNVWTGIFTGVPNNGAHSFNLVHTPTHAYNLVGNPFPSTVDATTFVQENNAVIEGTLYFYEHTLSMDSNGVFPTGTNYATWNATGGTAATAVAVDNPAYHTPAVIPNGSIQVGQGFFVSSKSNGVLNFTNSQRINDQNHQFLRVLNPEKNRLWINVSSENNVDINQIMIGYLDGATLNADSNYDGKSYGNIGSYLYSIIADEKYVIQGRPLPFEPTDEVPLGWICTTAGRYKIKLSDWDGLFLTEQAVYIKDLETGITTNLKLAPYTFTSETGVFNNRFTLVYEENLTTIDIPINSSNILVFKDKGYYHVVSSGILMQNISIFDPLGRLLFNVININSNAIQINELHQTKEILLLKIVDENLQTHYRKILN